MKHQALGYAGARSFDPSVEWNTSAEEGWSAERWGELGSEPGAAMEKYAAARRAGNPWAGP